MKTLEQGGKRKSKKVVLIIIAGLLAVILLITGYLLLTAKNRVTGVWTSESVYLREYGSDYTNLVTFGESGAYLSVLQITGGDLKDLDFGAWKMSGLEIEVSINGEMGKTIYHYNPITNKVTSGLWTFSKVG